MQLIAFIPFLKEQLIKIFLMPVEDVFSTQVVVAVATGRLREECLTLVLVDISAMGAEGLKSTVLE